jgi:hypothetical protein
MVFIASGVLSLYGPMKKVISAGARPVAEAAAEGSLEAAAVDVLVVLLPPHAASTRELAAVKLTIAAPTFLRLRPTGLSSVMTAPLKWLSRQGLMRLRVPVSNDPTDVCERRRMAKR